MTFYDILALCCIVGFIATALVLSVGLYMHVQLNKPQPALYDQIDWTSRAEVTSVHSL